MSTSSLITKAFWAATAQRVVRVFASTLASLLVADGTDLLNSDWVKQLSVSGMAAFLTLLLCIAGDTVTGGAGPAFGSVETLSPPAYPVQGSALKGDAGYTNGSTLLLVLAVVGVVLIVLFAVGVLR